MWVIFRDPHTVFNHLDKNVVQMVEDKDIGAYQATLQSTQGGCSFDVYPDVYFLQRFVTTTTGTEYYACRYRVWEPITTRLTQASDASPEVIFSLCSRPQSGDLTRTVIEDTIKISTYLIELREGYTLIGCLFLKDDEVTLLGVDVKKKGKSYSKLLINAAKKVVKDGKLRALVINPELAEKVFYPQGFDRTGGAWMATIQYTTPPRPTGPSLLRKL